MFTGIVKEMGLIKGKTSGQNGGIILKIISKTIKPKLGDSIAINGVCLTAKKISGKTFEVDVVPETLKRTNLKELKIGTAVNLEPAMTIADAVNGHFVLGHVDEAGAIIQTGNTLEISVPKKLINFIFEKGSIAVNGVSLTISSVNKSKNTFSSAIIPFTKTHTNLGGLKVGDKVNIEIDIMARYAKKQKNGMGGKLVTQIGNKIGIVASQYNKNISDGLLKGAQKAFQGKKNIEIINVPGVFEIPLMLKILADSGKFKGLIALGCVIKGETDHYDAVCKGVTYG
ncbi:MAG: riboflavin synthase, partial [Candidatus Woesebacteria bacterium]|nr:riboflavin synthase [Candidatus Woesebacteria bacterium]